MRFKKRVAILFLSCTFGFGSLQSSYAYWRKPLGTAGETNLTVAVGSFPELNESIRYRVNYGDRFYYRGLLYVSLIDTSFIPASIDWESPLKMFNRLSDQYCTSNYYDKFSRTVEYGKAEYQSLRFAAGTTPGSSAQWHEVNSEYKPGNTYPAKGAIVSYRGNFYQSRRYVRAGTFPGTDSAWGLIHDYSERRIYQDGELVAQNHRVYRANCKNPAFISSGDWDIYEIERFLDSRIVLPYRSDFTYRRNELIFAGYDRAERALIYQVKTSRMRGCNQSLQEFANYYKLLDNRLQ